MTVSERTGETAGGVQPSLTELEQRLVDACRAVGPMVVALSGGVDSALLAVAAHRALPGAAWSRTADSASLATGELEHCREFATTHGLDWASVATAELTDQRYLANEGDRCYWCKSALMDQLVPVAEELGATIVLGVNVDDLGDHRPGQHAAAERGAQFPLVDAGFTKTDIRRLAKAWGLEVWDRPAMPCLSSRIPYLTPVSVGLLSRIDRAEMVLRRLGFDDVRVRHLDETARIEVPADRIAALAAVNDTVVAEFEQLGYRYVTLDLAGLRSGNLNAALAT